jgi:hypothetical protein
MRLARILPSKHDADKPHGELEHTNLGKDRESFALPYVWGDLSGRRFIVSNGQLFAVARNLYYALQQLGARKCSPLWVDAISVRQHAFREDYESELVLFSAHIEKSMAVQNMGRVCYHVRQVFVSLGQHEDPSDGIFEIVSNFASSRAPGRQNFVAWLEDSERERHPNLEEVIEGNMRLMGTDNDPISSPSMGAELGEELWLLHGCSCQPCSAN